MSRRGENHLRQCSSSSNSVYIVVAVGCHACATRTNREVYVQTLFASRKNSERKGMEGNGRDRMGREGKGRALKNTDRHHQLVHGLT